MADQGAIGRTREHGSATDATYFPPKKHYVRSFYTPVTGSAMGRMREHATSSKQFNIHKLYSRPVELFWQSRQAAPGVFLSLTDPGRIAKVLRNLPHMDASPGSWNADGQIFGIVTDAAAPVAGVKVVLLYREPTITVITVTTTDANGKYRFTGLNPNKSGYLVLAFDPAGGTQYNVGRLDRVQPGIVLTGQSMTARSGYLAATHT